MRVVYVVSRDETRIEIQRLSRSAALSRARGAPLSYCQVSTAERQRQSSRRAAGAGRCPRLRAVVTRVASAARVGTRVWRASVGNVV